MIQNFKNNLNFPPVGYVRKGDPKGNGTIGKDLNTLFRVGFFPGNDESQAEFIGKFGGLKVKQLTVVLPFQTVPESWDCWFEAYTAGRMVARADGEKFIRLVDTKTGEVVVANGQPERAFDPKTPVGSYVSRSNNKEISIYAKPVGRLKFVLPELGRFAYFTLHTTSFYDCLNITEQLNALAMMTMGLPQKLAGVPLTLTRRMKEITWVKPDGQAQRISKGLISVEADPNWVKKMLAHMASRALPKGTEQMLLGDGGLNVPKGAPVPVEEEEADDLGYNPETFGDDCTDGDWQPAEEEVESEHETEAQPTQAPKPQPAEIPEMKIQFGTTTLGMLGVDQLTVITENPKVAESLRKAAAKVRDLKVGK